MIAHKETGQDCINGQENILALRELLFNGRRGGHRDPNQ